MLFIFVTFPTHAICNFNLFQCCSRLFFPNSVIPFLVEGSYVYFCLKKKNMNGTVVISWPSFLINCTYSAVLKFKTF